MNRTEETCVEWNDEGPMTQRCVYVQDRDSQRWIARVQVVIEGETLREPA